MDNMLTYSFCDPFLEKLQAYIRERYAASGKDLSRLAIVFGGKRPALFVKRNLARAFQDSFLPPVFFTIDEFIAYTVRKQETFQIPQDLDSCYLLYQLTQKHCPHILAGREGFAQFLPWAREILSFMDQLDLEHVPDEALRHIRANAEIGYDVPKDINRLLESVTILRQAYHKEASARQEYSRGYQYRRAAELISQTAFEEFDEILFCNFFYFNRSEEMIVKHLHREGKATLLFQGDQRKWPVLQRIARNFQYDLLEGEEPETPRFKLNLYEAFDIHSQVAQVREVLKNMPSLEDTVIVLPDPDQIVPLLSEIAPLAEEFNISMGYPLKRSSLYSLCSFMFQAQLSRKETRYYARDYLKVLRHPFVKNLNLQGEGAVTRVLIHKLEEILTGKEKTVLSGSSFLTLAQVENSQELFALAGQTLQRLGLKATQEQLRLVLKEIHEILFSSWESVRDFRLFAFALERFLNLIVEKSFMRAYPLNINIARKMYDLKEELARASFDKEPFLQEDLFRIFDHKISREIVAFVGSPLKGLQILGLFETRSLSFKNVIVLDVNEGSLPKLNIYEPLIPREVMISLNLDRLELEEEIQRYQFMRLLSSAENVHLVYQASKDKEKSRFVEELIWEQEKKEQPCEDIPLIKSSFTVKVQPQQHIIRKTPEVIAFLKEHTFSASSINTYLRDPVEFYFNYVLGLKETEDLLDEPEARHVGTFVHGLLEELFKPFLGKRPKFDVRFRSRATTLFEERFEETFGRTMKSDAFLLKRVIGERLGRFLDNEATNPERAVKEILHLESRFQDTLELPVGKVRFNFIMDRIDRLEDGTVLLVDYKTGSVDQMPKAPEALAGMELSCENIRQHIRSFQVPLYFYYLDQQYPNEQINAALYNLRTLKIQKFLNQGFSGDRSAVHETYLRALNFVLEEIFNPEAPFTSG